MSDKNMKDLRKQLRGLLLELLPDMLESTILAEMVKRIEAQSKATMKTIDDRHKDAISFMLRQAMNNKK